MPDTRGYKGRQKAKARVAHEGKEKYMTQPLAYPTIPAAAPKVGEGTSQEWTIMHGANQATAAQKQQAKYRTHRFGDDVKAGECHIGSNKCGRGVAIHQVPIDGIYAEAYEKPL